MKSKPRQSMLEVIDQLFGMIAVISTIQAGIDVMFLAEPTIDMLAVTAAEHSVYNVLAVNVVQLLQRSVRLYFQRKQLGADSSGGMLAGPQLGKRSPPPAAQDWGDFQCVKRTRFTVAQISSPAPSLRGLSLLIDVLVFCQASRNIFLSWRVRSLGMRERFARAPCALDLSLDLSWSLADDFFGRADLLLQADFMT